jgi:hypothetical protein
VRISTRTFQLLFTYSEKHILYITAKAAGNILYETASIKVMRAI